LEARFRTLPRNSARAWAPGLVVASRYRLERLLGKGGMGEVWSARDTQTFRAVAIKLVAFGTSRLDAVEARFRREATVAARLTGPAFVEVFDHGADADEAFLVMELLSGETLEERLRRVETFDLGSASKLIDAMSVALEIAHAQRIVHRDLKPANVFFAESRASTSGVFSLASGAETIKLFDFGVAKDGADESRLTRPDMLLGSAHYMAPEQIRAVSEVDARADVWSLAVILFRLLTGSLPFEGERLEVLVRIIQDRPREACAVRPSLPPAMETFFRRAFEKSPDRRFQSVAELRVAFAKIVAHPHAVVVEPQSVTIPAPKAVARTIDPPTCRPTVIDWVAPTLHAPTAAKPFSWVMCALSAFLVAALGVATAVSLLLH